MFYAKRSKPQLYEKSVTIFNMQRLLAKLHKELSRTAFKGAKRDEFDRESPLYAYSRKFFDSIPDNVTALNQEKFFESMDDARLILFGDFHTLDRSQKAFLKLVKTYRKHNRKAKSVICLENFRSADQRVIDDYLAGSIGLQDLHSKTEYETNWGFPWTSYQAILHFAKVNRVPVYGVNEGSSLESRDNLIGKRLRKISHKHPDSRVFCLIGEFHLGDNNLPRELEETEKVFRVLHNVDKYFDNCVSTHQEEYFWLKDNLFCLMDTPPWMKWQSFADWEDQLSSEFDEYTENEVDVEYRLRTMLISLGNFLDLPVKEESIFSFHLMERPQIQDIQESLNEWEYGLLFRNGAWYSGQANKAFVCDEGNLEQLAFICGQWMTSVLSEDGGKEDNFSLRVLSVCAGTLAKKIFNPKRRTTSYDEIRNVSEREFSALEFFKDLLLNQSADDLRKVGENIASLDRRGEFSQCLGEVLATRIYEGAMLKKLTQENLKIVFKSELPTSWDTLREILKITQLR